MLASYHTRVDTFDLRVDPESGVIELLEVGRLSTIEGYLPSSWMEAHSQLKSARSLMGALC
jgi:hypothetical protein